MKKYNKITKQQVLDLYKEMDVVNREAITRKYGCSIYSARIAVEDLLDDGKIKLTNYGYRRNESAIS